MAWRRPIPFRTLAAGVVTAVAVLPDRLRVDSRFPFVDSVSLRPQAVAGALAVAAALAPARATRPLAVGMGAVGLVGLAAVAGRGVRRPVGPVPADGTDLTVLTANVLKGRADTGELATLIEREHPDVVVLPEAGHDYRDKLMPLVEGLGYRACVSTPPGARDVHSVTVLVSDALGDVRLRAVREMRLAHVEVTGGRLGGRVFRGIHATAPLQRRLIPRWRDDMEVLGRWCRSTPAPVVAGDFNATHDHSAFRAALGGTRSAAAGTGKGLVGTYPARFPRWFGIHIDHVLVPAGTVTRRLEVVDLAGTDHRAVLAEVTLGRAG
ncbi:endonuclease/exonuclease/phosphatase family protein [Pseudonocardia humida]|uniref:Endonuclease/exonuclease/phosphatase family protein n=1 Tax=Pseudonocardia humida TaxID=2800819 RepID=A0ABT1A5J0_9PSEU|nr:endonuclease/exonuclease/phosphatase family protein [Pseudonocardia humida]MCO1658292.1 endonuclease/exonuclease/phosphatase family protein [Pseudonocardia humida]